MFNIGVLLGILFVVISLPLVFDKIKPNRWYGFRTAKTLSNPEIWYKANRFMAKNIIAAGVVIAVLCAVLPLFKSGLDSLQGMILFQFIITVPIIIAIINSVLYLRKL